MRQISDKLFVVTAIVILILIVRILWLDFSSNPKQECKENIDLITSEVIANEDNNEKCSCNEMCTFFEEDFRNMSANQFCGNTLFGKSINVIGDSYVANDDECIEKTWHYKLALKYGMLYRNYGINGNSLITKLSENGSPVISRYDEMDEADYILVIGGKNDYNIQCPIEDFITGMNELCEGLLNKYPNATIIFFTPWKSFENEEVDPAVIKLQQYTDAMVKVCESYSIPIYDASKSETMKVYDSFFQDFYMQNTGDISHLNKRGHNLFFKEAESFLLNN